MDRGDVGLYAGRASVHKSPQTVIGLLVPARLCFAPAAPMRSIAIKRLVTGRYARGTRIGSYTICAELGYWSMAFARDASLWSHRAQALEQAGEYAPAQASQPPSSLRILPILPPPSCRLFLIRPQYASGELRGQSLQQHCPKAQDAQGASRRLDFGLLFWSNVDVGRDGHNGFWASMSKIWLYCMTLRGTLRPPSAVDACSGCNGAQREPKTCRLFVVTSPHSRPFSPTGL